MFGIFEKKTAKIQLTVVSVILLKKNWQPLTYLIQSEFNMNITFQFNNVDITVDNASIFYMT